MLYNELMLKAGSRKGFTLVELLIVIVVIGVLATIVMVAYGNVGKKANYAKMSTDVTSYVNLMKMWKAEFSTTSEPYPLTTLPNGVVAMPFCMGDVSQYPAADGFAAGECAYYTGVSIVVNDDINSKLLQVASQLPSASFPAFSFDAGGGLIIHVRGIIYQVDESHSPPVLSVGSIGPSDMPCPQGQSSPFGAGASQCMVTLE